MVIARRLLGQAAEEAHDARDVEALLTLGHRAAEDQILDLSGFTLREPWSQQPADHLARELVRAGARASP
jgi:hypothetical protein